MTEIPWDFVVDKKNLSKKQLETRFQYANGNHIFWKDKLTADEQQQWDENRALPRLPEPEDGSSPLDDFGKRFNEFRCFIQDMALPRLMETFLVWARSFFSDRYPDCKTLDDYLTEYRTGPCDNQRRSDIHVMCHLLWLRECIKAIEQMVMKVLFLVYCNYLIDIGENDSHTPKTRRTGGTIGGMINRMRQTTYVERFRITGLGTHGEVIYMRKLAKPMEGVCHVEKVTKVTHGHDGFLGFGINHPFLLTLTAANRPVKPATSETQSLQLMDYLQNLMNQGDEKAAEYLEGWKRRQLTVVEVSDAASSPNSSVTSVSQPSQKTTVSSAWIRALQKKFLLTYCLALTGSGRR